MSLIVATCQFPVCDDAERNTSNVRRQMRIASELGAHVAHFCEGCLSGYAGVDLTSFADYDWRRLRACTERVMEDARRLQLWALIGSAHPLSRGHKPHNSVYVIDDRGQLVDRYDKRFCAGPKTERSGDLKHYTPGDHFSVFEIRGVRCGVLICHDYRYPELYREYKRRDVQLLLHSYHAGNITRERFRTMQEEVGEVNHPHNRGTTLPEITMPATMQAAAASSHMWISCSNSSARQSCWPSFFVRPDGVITGRLRRNVSGVLLSNVDLEEQLYDSTNAWRERALRGQYHSGTLVRDPRSEARTEL